MHYDGLLRGNVPTPIITNLTTGQIIGVNREMSLLDIQKLNEMYPCIKPTVPTVPITVPITVAPTIPPTVPPTDLVCGKLC